MKNIARALFVCFVTMLGAGTASAGLFRAYLSFTGNDGNPCTVLAPCRLLPAALAAVNDGGEIWMVDSANYNVTPVTIGKSVKILAISGALGSLIANGGDAVIINAPGGTVTLKNLSVLNFNAGINGITIQDASGVHLEKVSIDGFTTDASSCINMPNLTTTVRVWVDDSFLRECRNGIYVNQPVGLPSRGNVTIDNTRFERSTNTGGSNGSAVWMKGSMDVSIRNSVITRQTSAIQFDNLVANNVSHLEIINTELTRNTTCLQFTNTAGGASGQIMIVGSHFAGCSDAMIISNNAVGGNTWIKIMDTMIAYTSNNGITAANSAADVNTRMGIELIRSQITNMTNTAVDLNVTNGCQIQFFARDSTLSNANRLLKTSGSASFLQASLIRSHLNNSAIAVDHGLGAIELDGSHINYNTNSLVNNGSPTIVSMQNNFINNNTDSSGLTYITSFTNIAPK